MHVRQLGRNADLIWGVTVKLSESLLLSFAKNLSSLSLEQASPPPSLSAVVNVGPACASPAFQGEFGFEGSAVTHTN
jgi:hypothetical protein